MPSCAIKTCHNNDRNYKEKGVTFHRFPKDERLRKAWIRVCNRLDDFNPDNVKVCSVHFCKDDFERDLKSELLSSKPKKQLKCGVIPRFNLPTSPKNTEITKHAARTGNIDCSSIVECIIEDSNYDEKNKEIALYKDENYRLKDKLQCVSKELVKVKKENLELQSTVIKLKQLFSEKQLKFIEKGSCTSWSFEDISKAVTLRSISKKSFDYVRSYLKYPLPSETTVKRRLSHIKILPGFISISFDLLKSHANVFTEDEKDVILSYDEIKVKHDLCYDNVDEVFKGPYNYLQMVIVRCLIGKWKQPVFYDFDRALNKDLLYEVIKKVEETGFRVHGFVGDMSPSNEKLFSNLGISEHNTSIPNPIDDQRRIWVFCDVPDLLKLLRNHLLDKGFKLSDRKLVQKDVLEKVISEKNNDITFLHKVKSNHFSVKESERQNVRKAAELISGSMALAVDYLYKDKDHVKDFLQTINDGFDVLNSHEPKHSNKLKSGYGMYLNEQNEALKKLYDLCLSMRVIGETNLLPFQRGFLISINSIKGLYSDLQNKGYSYLITSRCNQDALKSYFSLIKGLGKFYDLPPPTAVTQRMKSLLLIRNASPIIESQNCLNDDTVTLSVNVLNSFVGKNDDKPNYSDVNLSISTDVLSNEDAELVELEPSDLLVKPLKGEKEATFLEEANQSISDGRNRGKQNQRGRRGGRGGGRGGSNSRKRQYDDGYAQFNAKVSKAD